MDTIDSGGGLSLIWVGVMFVFGAVVGMLVGVRESRSRKGHTRLTPR